VRKTRKTEITFETERLLIFSRRPAAREDWCEGCGREALWLPAEEAARAAGVSLRELCRMVEARRLHFAETEGGALFICFDSLKGAQA